VDVKPPSEPQPKSTVTQTSVTFRLQRNVVEPGAGAVFRCCATTLVGLVSTVTDQRNLVLGQDPVRALLQVLSTQTGALLCGFESERCTPEAGTHCSHHSMSAGSHSEAQVRVKPALALDVCPMSAAVWPVAASLASTSAVSPGSTPKTRPPDVCASAIMS
jgi:hypothetical protein